MFIRLLIFSGSLTIINNASNHSKCISLYNQQYMTQHTLLIFILMKTINDCNPFLINLDRCTGGCNTLDYLFNRICFLNNIRCKKCF